MGFAVSKFIAFARYTVLMHSSATLAAFLSAAILLAISPGPGMIYVLTRSLAGGRREGILSSLGTLVGGFVHVLAAGFGLSAILFASSTAYQIVRWTGAIYLVYLGIKMYRSASQDNEIETPGSQSGNPFLQGIVTETLNPKTALFFLSFIPQFVSPQFGPVLGQFLLLGSICVCLNTCVDLSVAIFAGPIGRHLLASRQARTNQRKATGLVMVGLGVYVVAREN